MSLPAPVRPPRPDPPLPVITVPPRRMPELPRWEEESRRIAGERIFRRFGPAPQMDYRPTFGVRRSKRTGPGVFAAGSASSVVVVKARDALPLFMAGREVLEAGRAGKPGENGRRRSAVLTLGVLLCSIAALWMMRAVETNAQHSAHPAAMQAAVRGENAPAPPPSGEAVHAGAATGLPGSGPARQAHGAGGLEWFSEELTPDDSIYAGE